MEILSSDPKNRALKYFLLVTLAVGAAGSLFTAPNIPAWYAGLNHPAIAPPNWVFAPVWTTLYVLMAVAAWRVWKITGFKSIEMLAFAVQLALNFAWSGIFFGLHQIGPALGEIILLDLAILYALLLFWRRDRLAGALMLPYLAWTLFATLLTRAFWLLNP
ncbi:MAG TPA: TspO/MBR family protein [Rhizomicrobium sp.]|jgi:tryptophan-rich sensory protein|nr:TspO/MBR family protein [Rhizomicrobium sp.]